MDKRYSLYAILIISVMLMGEIGEIKTQTVPLYDYIKQYAVVKYIDNGATYNKYCEDCTCTLSITKELGETLFEDKSTSLLSEGLYGYRATPNEFETDKTYTARFFCLSPTYGNGTVYSSISIIKQPSAIATTGADDVSDNNPGTPPGNEIEDGLFSGIYKYLVSIKNAILEIPVKMGQAIADALNITEGIGDNGLYKTIKGFITGITGTLSAIFGLFIGLFTDPKKAWWNIILFLWNIFAPLLLVLGVPIALYEFYVVSLFINKPVNEFLKTFIEYQIAPIKMAFNLFNFFKDLLTSIFFMVTDSVKALGSLIPFT